VSRAQRKEEYTFCLTGESSMAAIHALVLTNNEEIHIERCLRSIQPVCETITVVDSGSTDRTVAIAMRLGAEVVFNRLGDHGSSYRINLASQGNFAIAKVADRGGWVLRIDADEVLDECSQQISGDALDRVGQDVNGILIQRRIYFLGRRIRWGGH
jgi:glycosyltransferase involved in cell wall biosynthesis